MADAFHRIQLRRVKGWRMPPNTVSVARPGKWGNPFKVSQLRDLGMGGSDHDLALKCVEAFRIWLGPLWQDVWQGEQSERQRSRILADLASLRGKNLACFCALDAACHADVLLRMANPSFECEAAHG